MRRGYAVAICLLLSCYLALDANADAPGTLTKDSVNLNLKGVSPYVEKLANGDDRLYFPSEEAFPGNILIVD